MEKIYQNEISSIELYTIKKLADQKFKFVGSSCQNKENVHLQKDDQFNKNIKYAVAKISAGALLGCSAYLLNSFGISIQFGVILFLFFPVGLFAGFLLAMPQLQAMQKI
jgi:hypothetical protein